MYNNGFGGAALGAADPRQSVYPHQAMAAAASAQALALQEQAQQQQQLMLLAGYQQQMTMMAGMGAAGGTVGFPPSGPGPAPGSAMASTPNLLGMGAGLAGMSTPNLFAGGMMGGALAGPYARHSTMGGAAPPAMGMGMGMGTGLGMQGMTPAQQQMMFDEPFLDEPGRERIDAWRQSVQMD